MRDVQPGALHGWDEHVLPSCVMRLLLSTHDFACATGLGMGQAGTSALERGEALQAGLLLLRLSLGCLKPAEACRRQSAFGGPRQEWSTASSEYHVRQLLNSCANRAATRRCRYERWLCYFWE